LPNCYRWKRSGRHGPGGGDGQEDGAVPERGGDGRVVVMAERTMRFPSAVVTVGRCGLGGGDGWAAVIATTMEVVGKVAPVTSLP
jgi:hypothetical protein